MNQEIYHIRKPLRPSRGNQFYRDKSDRGQGTYCGAPEGYKDIPNKWKPQTWNDGNMKQLLIRFFWC